MVRIRRGFWLRSAVFLLKPVISTMTRPHWVGRELVPPPGPDGGVILVANHLSKTDPFTLGYFVYRLPRNPRFLGKATLFSKPVIGAALKGAGQIPVHRHSADAAKALEHATAALHRGELVIMHPEGTCTKDPDLWPMRGKSGAVRLALMTGKPLLPVAQWGMQRLHHPVTNVWRPRFRTPVTVVVGEPIDLSAYEDRPLTTELLTEATDLVMARIRTMLAEIRGVEAPTGPLYDLVAARRTATAGKRGEPADGSSEVV